MTDGNGNARGIAILEYVPGDPLDACGIPAEKIVALLERFFL